MGFSNTNMENTFSPSVILGLGISGEKIIDGIYKRIFPIDSLLKNLTFISITSKETNNTRNFVKVSNSTKSHIEFQSSKLSRGIFLEDFRKSNIPSILRDKLVREVYKNAESGFQIILVASLGEIETGLIGDILYHLHLNMSANNFTSYLCLTFESLLHGNRIRDEEIYAQLRELSRLGTYGYHLMGISNEKTNSMRAYDFMFLFENAHNYEVFSDTYPDSFYSAELFIENLIREDNYLLRSNVVKSFSNSIENDLMNKSPLGYCFNSSLRQITNPSKKIKHFIAIRLLENGLLDSLSQNEIVQSTLHYLWNQVEEKSIEWFRNYEDSRAKKIYSYIFNNSYDNGDTLDPDLASNVKIFKNCIYQGIKTTLHENVDYKTFVLINYIISFITEKINGRINSLKFENNTHDEIRAKFLKEVFEESQDIKREIEEWLAVFNSDMDISSQEFSKKCIREILENKLEDSEADLFFENSVQKLSVDKKEIKIFIDNFLRNSINGTYANGKRLIESLKKYISVNISAETGFQIQLFTGNNDDRRIYDIDSITCFIDDCLNYIEDNLDVKQFKVNYLNPILIDHLNSASFPSCKIEKNCEHNNHLQYSSYVISGPNVNIEKKVDSIFPDISSLDKNMLINKKSENGISTIRVFYNIPINELESVNKFVSNYYSSSDLYIFQQEKNVVHVEKELKKIKRGSKKVFLPAEIVDLLFDMNLVDMFLKSMILGILIKEKGKDGIENWRFEIKKTGRYMEPVIGKVELDGVNEIYRLLKIFSLEMPNNSIYRNEKAGHFFYYLNKSKFLDDLQDEINKRGKDFNIKDICKKFWREILAEDYKTSLASGVLQLFIYETWLLLKKNLYDLEEVTRGGLDEL